MPSPRSPWSSASPRPHSSRGTPRAPCWCRRRATCGSPQAGQERYLLRLEPRFRGTLYAVASALLVTGTAWLVVDRLKPIYLTQAWQQAAAYLLVLHGGAAMLML